MTRARTLSALAGIALWYTSIGVALAAAPSTCDRTCLASTLDGYLSALAARDPSRAALAPDVRMTENGALVRPGEGLWQTVTRIGDYRIDALDPVAGQAGFIGRLVTAAADRCSLSTRRASNRAPAHISA